MMQGGSGSGKGDTRPVKRAREGQGAAPDVSPVLGGEVLPDAEDLRRQTGKCPICGKPRVLRYRPFCSKRCADIDLGRWLSEDYRMPISEDERGSDSEAGGR